MVLMASKENVVHQVIYPLKIKMILRLSITSSKLTTETIRKNILCFFKIVPF